MGLNGYRLVVCPKCKTPKILDKDSKTSECYKCKKKLQWSELASYGEYKTPEEASKGIMRYKGLHVFEYANKLQEKNLE